MLFISSKYQENTKGQFLDDSVLPHTERDYKSEEIKHLLHLLLRLKYIFIVLLNVPNSTALICVFILLFVSYFCLPKWFPELTKPSLCCRHLLSSGLQAA